MKSIGELAYELNSTSKGSKLMVVKVTCTCSLYTGRTGPWMPYELVYRAVTERATITLRVLLRAGRCYRLTGYAQEMCSALGFIAGLRNGHMQEHLSTRACDC